MLQEFGPSLYVADGPTASFYGFPYPTRMAVARLSDGSAWVWSPIALTEELARQVESIGPVRHVVAPNKLHHLFLAQWAGRWPEARLYAAPGLARRRTDLHFHGELGDQVEAAWATDIDQALFRGSVAMVETVFFHRASRTVILCDLVQRLPAVPGLKGLVMRLDGLIGERGSTPREWRCTFLRRRLARRSRDRVLAWNPERLLIAHGQCARDGATALLQDALGWV